MTQFSKNFKQRVVSIVTLFTLFLALNASGALAGFWRTLDNLTSNGIDNAQDFLYGYGYGNGGWWYGYGYGYGYGDYGYGYGAISDAYNLDQLLDSLTSSFNSNGFLLQNFTLPFTGFSIELPQGLKITDSSGNAIDTQSLTWFSLSSVTGLTGFDLKWAVKFGIEWKVLNFTKAVKIEIPVTGATSVVAKVKHFGDASYGYTWLTTTAEAACTAGQATDSNQRYAGTSITVISGKAVIYACSASEFAWANPTESSGGGSGWGSWGSGWGSWGSGWGSWGSVNVPTNQTGSTATGSSVVETTTQTTDVVDTVNDDTYTTKTTKDGKVTITKADGTKVVLSDIKQSFAKAYIEKLAAAGIVAGYADGSFKPEKSASRAEYLKIVLRAMNIDYSNVDTSKLTFKDVEKDSWIAKVVIKAAELNMIDASNNNFRPNAQISRAEAMKMLINAAEIQTNENAVSEFNDVKGWAVKYVQKAKELGIVNGQNVNGKVLFRPAENITRAEVSKIVVKTMEQK